MKEPERIPLNPDTPTTQKVETIKMPPLKLYDDFGYYSSIEICDENNKKSDQT